MSSHQMTIEFDARFQKRWLVICACGFQHRAKDQLEAEETVASHKNRFGDTYSNVIDECEVLIENWRRRGYAICADELDALLDRRDLMKRQKHETAH